MKKIVLAYILLLLAAGPVSAADITVEGGAPAIEKVLKPAQEGFEKASGHKLKMLASGPKIALQNLDQGKISAAVGPSFDDWLKFMAKEGAPVKDPSVYRPVVIGQDRIIVITHKDNPVAALSPDQLKTIFTGKTDNWKAVGGPDAPIMIVTGQLIKPAVDIFYGKILQGEQPTKDQMVVSTAQDVRQSVAANKEAIGVVSYKIVDATVKAPQVPEVPIVFTLVTKGAPSPEVQQLIDFLVKK